MAEYMVKIVREEWKSNWYEFWDTKREPSEETKELAMKGHLGISLLVKAKTKQDAEAKALEARPGFVAISEDTRKRR